ncbi:hypothetical protein ABIA45_000174 [Bradyrhizobium sp. USDA 336]
MIMITSDHGHILILGPNLSRSVPFECHPSLGEALPYLETPAKQLISLQANSAIFSKCSLESLNIQTDLDSAILAFAQGRRCCRTPRPTAPLRLFVWKLGIWKGAALPVARTYACVQATCQILSRSSPRSARFIWCPPVTHRLAQGPSQSRKAASFVSILPIAENTAVPIACCWLRRWSSSSLCRVT